MAQRRNSPILKFVESLTGTGGLRFQPTDLLFGTLVEPQAAYELAKNFQDTLINGRAMASQT